MCHYQGVIHNHILLLKYTAGSHWVFHLHTFLKMEAGERNSGEEDEHVLS